MAPPTFGELTGATGSEASTSAVDELSRALGALDLSNVASGADALTTAQRDLSRQLKILQDQAKENVRATKDQLRQGKISGEKASKLISQQNKAIERLNKAVEAETKGKMAGVKEYEKLLATTRNVNKEFEWTRDNIQKNRMLDRQWYREQARRTKEWAKASERIDEFNSALEKVPGKLSTEYLGQGIVTSVQESLTKRAQAPGAGKGMRRAATTAIGFGAIAALFSKLTDIRQQALAIVGPKIFNYGLQGLDDLDEKILATQRSLNEFRKEANKFGIEGETANQLFMEIGKATGETDENIRAAGKSMFRAVQAGFLPAGEAAQILSARMNTVGISAKEAAEEVEDLAMMARETGAVQMEDFVSAVQEVSKSINTLVSDQKGLGKSMAFLISQGKNLELSYDRRANAAKNLTSALASSYDMGFATLEVQSELEAVMGAGRRRGAGKVAQTLGLNAQEIQRMIAEGTVTTQTAARLLKEVGATQTAELQSERMRRLALDVVDRGVEYAQARIGRELTLDEIKLMSVIGNIVKRGGSIEEYMKEASESTTASYDKLSKEIAKRQYKGKGLMDTSVDEFFTSMGRLMAPLLEMLPGVLGDIKTTLDMITGSSWFKSMFGVKGKQQLERERKVREIETLTRQGSGSIAGLLGSITKENVPFYMTDAAFDESQVKRLVSDKGLQEKYGRMYHRPFTKAEEVALRSLTIDDAALNKQARDLIEAFRTEYGKKPSVSGVEINGSRLAPDGSTSGDVTVSYRQPGAAESARQTSSTAAEAAASSNRQHPAR